MQGALTLSALGGGILQTDGNGVLSTTTVGAASITDDSLGFAQFMDALTLDASTDIAIAGSHVLSITNTGTGNSLLVNDEAGDATPFTIDASGNLTIGGAITSGIWNGTDIDISDFTNLAVAATGLTLSDDTVTLESGYSIPQTASTTNWNTFYDTPSTRVAAGDALTWSGNTLNFDGGDTPGGSLGGTWASPTIDDLFVLNTGDSISGNLTLSGTSANIILGSNYLSGDGGDEGVFVDSSGNVGIGTTTPGQKLSVAGDSYTSGFINTSGATGGYQIDGTLILQASSTNSSLLAGQSAGAALLADGLNNTALGYEALKVATSSDYNTAVGASALRSNTTGYNNTANGYAALYSNTTGHNNTANGMQALLSNTTGHHNTANGAQALYLNTTGTYNTAVGTSALFSNTTGTTNTANGMNALFSNTTGYQNTANGMSALYSNTTGHSNTALGYNAGYGSGTVVDNRSVIDTQMTFLGTYASRDSSVASTSALTNGIAIGYDAKVLASNQVVLGNDSVTTTLLKGNVGIGTTGPGSKLSVNGGDIALTSSGNSPALFVGDVITAGNYGYLQWNSTDDYLLLRTQANSSGIVVNESGNVGIGTTNPSTGKLQIDGLNYNENLITLQVSNQTSRTYGIGTYLTGTGAGFAIRDNTAATERLVITDTGNVGIGTTSPSFAVGGGLQVSNSNGGVVSLVDPDASGTLDLLKSNSDGYIYNRSNGLLLFGTNNAERLRITSTGNVGIGTTGPNGKLEIRQDSGDAISVLSAVTTADTAGRPLVFKNLFSSGSAGLGVARIGWGTGSNVASGYLSFETATNSNSPTERMRITNTGNVGIGETAPGSKLSVSGGGSFGASYDTTAAPTNGLIIEGNVGIGTTTPTRKLSVSGTVGFTGLGTGAGAGSLCLDSGNQVVYSAGASCTVSSKQFKHDIESLTEAFGLEAVAGLRPVSFVYNDDIGVPGAQVGFIAEEVLNVDPRLVVLDADGRPRGVKYENLTALLAKSIQELDARTAILADVVTVPEDGSNTIWERLTMLANGFVDGVLTATAIQVEHVRSDHVETEEIQATKLCLEDVCVTKDQLQALLSGQAQPSAQPDEGSSSEDAPASPNTGQDTASEDDAEVVDAGTDDGGADDTGVDLDDGATSTIDTIDLDDSEIDEVIAPPPLQEVATPSQLAQ